MTALLRSDQVRQLLRLMGECIEIRRANDDASSHFLTGLGRITRSTIGIRAEASVIRPEAPPVVAELQDFGWATTSDRDRVYGYLASQRLSDDPLSASLLVPADAPLVTRLRQDAVPGPDWGRSEIRNDVHRPAGVDDSILSLAWHSPTSGRLLAFKRAWGEPPYSREDRDLVHLAHAECGWLFAREPEPTPNLDEGWSPRERDVRDLLLTGVSEKVAAARLGLSPHTLHGYVKTIYRKLGVSSRAELMALALDGAAPKGLHGRRTTKPTRRRAVG